jgi:hypothetical protein
LYDAGATGPTGWQGQFPELEIAAIAQDFLAAARQFVSAKRREIIGYSY